MQLRTPWDPGPQPESTPPLPTSPPAARRRGRPPRSAPLLASATGTAPDWLYHHLTVSGPAAEVSGFAATARGAGVIPWRLDFARIEDDVFNHKGQLQQPSMPPLKTFRRQSSTYWK
jgi:hypothetical protein